MKWNYCRFCVQPNDGFEQQLKEFEPIYRARLEMTGSVGNGGGKRERDEEADMEESFDSSVKCRVQDAREELMDL